MPKGYSAKFVIRILTTHFGFVFISQRGSHIKLRKRNKNGHTITTIVPDHKELSHGTLRSILKLAQVDYEIFRKIAD
ncbi:MAG: type II toxin-antitoxin system HicA family toxin [Patescibacteria group bacterium]